MKKRILRFARFLMEHSQQWEKQIERAPYSKIPRQRSFLAERVDAFSQRFLVVGGVLLFLWLGGVKWWQAIAAVVIIILILKQNKSRLQALKIWGFSNFQPVKRARFLFFLGMFFGVLAIVEQGRWEWYWGGIGMINFCLAACFWWAGRLTTRAG